MKKISGFIIRILITILVLFFLLKRLNISETLEIIKQSNWIFLIFALAGIFGASFIIALRWYQILKAYKFNVSLYSIFKIYMISFFFNNFLPSAVGMDIVRGAYITKDKKQLPDVISTILLERLIGFLGIIVYVSIIPLLFYSRIQAQYFLYVSFIGGFFFIMFFILIWNEFLFNKLFTLFEKITLLGIGNKINKLYISMRYIRNHKKLFIINFFLSVSIQIFFVISNYFIVISQNLNISVFELIVYVPLISIVSMIPFTINGIGLREWAYITFFNSVTNERALSLSITFFIIITLFSLLGGVYFLILKKEKEIEK